MIVGLRYCTVEASESNSGQGGKRMSSNVSQWRFGAFRSKRWSESVPMKWLDKPFGYATMLSCALISYAQVPC